MVKCILDFMRMRMTITEEPKKKKKSQRHLFHGRKKGPRQNDLRVPGERLGTKLTASQGRWGVLPGATSRLSVTFLSFKILIENVLRESFWEVFRCWRALRFLSVQ